MNVLHEIKQMSYSEKLMMMELLWKELFEQGVQSPDWHKDILDAREGNEKYIDWGDAKRIIRKCIG